MKIVIRLLSVCVLMTALSSPGALASSEKGTGPYETGEKFFAKLDYRTALQYYRKALGLNDVRAHYRMGLIYEDAGRDRDALKHYQRYIDLGRPGAQRTDAARRARAIEERLSRESTRSSTLLERGKALITEGKYREAEQVLLQAAREDEADPEIHFYLGEVYMALEDYSRAEAEYNKARESY